MLETVIVVLVSVVLSVLGAEAWEKRQGGKICTTRTNSTIQ